MMKGKYVATGDGTGRFVEVLDKEESHVVVGDEFVSDSNPIPIAAPAGGLPTRPFDHAGTVSLSATSSSARVALPAAGSTMIVRNYGPNRVFIKRGGGTVTAAATDYPVEAYTIDYLYRDLASHTHLAAICANSGETASLSINCGEGGA